MSISQSKTSKIANNTIVLYLRTIVTMLIALYTSRVVLGALGVEDYGLYGVIGGVVVMFSLITAGLNRATQRFLSYELGRGESGELTKVFSSCVITHLLFALITLLFCETVGVWFLNHYIQIPGGRIGAANWIFQFSIITVCINLITIPYTACIISYERMSVYAYVGIFDSILKLLIAFLIASYKSDRLILYGGLIMLISVVNLSIYVIVCNRSYKETSFSLVCDKSIFKRILSFTSWTMLGEGGMVCANQGNNILINLFYSVTANAANAIGDQVNTAIRSLSLNFFSACVPQITKSYASNDYAYTLKLIYGASKLSFYLIFLFACPIILNIDLVLKLWLGSVPNYTNLFCVIFITSSMVNSIGNASLTVIYAGGKIKRFQIITTLLYLSDVIFVYVFFRFGFPVVTAPLMKLIIDLGLLTLRIVYTKKFLPLFSYRQFISKALLPIIFSSAIALLLGYIIKSFAINITEAVLFAIISFVISIFIIYYIGLTKEERSFVFSFVKSRIKK